MPRSPEGRYLRASEVGEYVYCRRAWWLHRVRGHRPANQPALVRGRRAHTRHGRTVARAARLRRAAWLMLAAGLTLLALWALGVGPPSP